MKHSCKQLFRTPIKLILCGLAVVGSTALCVLGLLLWQQAESRIRALEENFTTLATVEQIPNATELSSVWDAALGDYIHSSAAVYDTFLPVDLLEEMEFPFVAGPEKRPYYGAHLPQGMTTTASRQATSNYYMVEFTPRETCVPTQPVRLDVVQVFFGNQSGDSLWFCDHFSQNPPPLEKGKHYIACMQYWPNAHGEAIATTVEFVPLLSPYTTQCDRQGNRLESSVIQDRDTLWEEVTPDFYETGRGQYWLNLAHSLQGLDTTIPVLPTDSLTLLPSFHQGKATLVQEEGITQEEFQQGASVCLVTEEFAQANGLSLGDSLPLSLYFANYHTPASQLFGYVSSVLDFSLLNGEGQEYPTFFEGSYTIVGIYRYSPDGSESIQLGASEMGRDMVIVPAKSVGASDAANIADYGPMSATTTSFQIENGSIAACETALGKVDPSQFLSVTFDDNGYTQILGSVSQVRTVALLLCVLGIVCVLLVLFLLLYFFVVKQQRRIALERALGWSKGRCKCSILSGLLVVVTVCALLEGVASLAVTKAVSLEAYFPKEGAVYSTQYSVGERDMDPDSEAWKNAESATGYPEVLGMAAVVLTVTAVGGTLLLNRTLKKELLPLLSGKA